MKTSGNTIFITGGTSGIGRGLAEAFHAKGNKVIIGGRRKALLDEVAKANPGIETVEVDVNDPAQIQSVSQELVRKYPALNVLINNAGVMPFDDVTGPLDDAAAVSMITTNLLGPVRFSGALIEHLKKQPDAVIINNSSVAAFIPMAMFALYSATKAAVHSYTLSHRFALRDTSVSVLEIAPPWVDTDLVYKSGVIEIDAPPLSEELKKRWSYFIRKVYETDPLTCPKCQGEMRIISFIDQPDVVKKILQHLGLWEESQAPPERHPAIKELTFDPSYSQLI